MYKGGGPAKQEANSAINTVVKKQKTGKRTLLNEKTSKAIATKQV